MGCHCHGPQRRRNLLSRRLRLSILLLCPAVSLLSPLNSRAAAPDRPGQDWPMYRGGPGLLGVAAGSLGTHLTLRWNVPVGGPVRSSAAVVGERVYVGSGDSQVYCLDLKDGRKLWSFATKGEVESSPLVREGRIFVGSNDGWLYALDAEKGSLIWKFETGDKMPGSPNWVRAPSGQGDWILAGSHDFRLYSLEAATGKSNWVYESSNFINGAPAVAEGMTVFGGCDALLHLISLADGTQVREVEAGAYIMGSVALDGSRAFVGHYDNEVLCADLKEGKVLWRYRDRSFPYASSPAVLKDRVIIGGNDKRVHCVSRDKGEAIWVFGTRGKVESSPVVCGDKVVVGSDDGRLYLVSVADGSEVASYEIGQPIKASPAVARGLIVIGAEDGRVYAFEAGRPEAGKAL